MVPLLLVAIALAAPLLSSDYLLRAVLTPLVIYCLAAVGLNVLVGYCGQISLGTGAFMSVGAYAAFNVLVRVQGAPLVLAILAGGVAATMVGLLFGIPSLRIRGLYLAVATLAVQFLADWVFTRYGWFTNHSPSGIASVPRLEVFGWQLTTPGERYYLCLCFLLAFSFIVRNLIRSGMGRAWMAVRDMDLAAAVIGIRPIHAKLTAFALSSCICGVAGALFAFVYLGAWEPSAFGLERSMQILFMVIVGGLGSLYGPFLGAAFLLMLPLLLDRVPGLLGLTWSTTFTAHVIHIAYGALILIFLVAEPHGLAKLTRWRSVPDSGRSKREETPASRSPVSQPNNTGDMK